MVGNIDSLEIRTEPLIADVATIINEITKIYEDVEYNERICNALMDRVQIAESAIKILNNRKQEKENEKNFRNKEYYSVFVKFIEVMKGIRDFIRNISKLQGYRNFSHANSTRVKFNSLVNDFETVIKDLNFTITIANEEQRRIDQEALAEVIANITNVSSIYCIYIYLKKISIYQLVYYSFFYLFNIVGNDSFNCKCH